MAVGEPFSLAGWRREVNALYERIRTAVDPREAWRDFLATRERLFRDHPQTPLSGTQLAPFRAPVYYPYRREYRVEGALERDAPGETFHLKLDGDGTFSFTRVAYVHFTLSGETLRLGVYWIEGYGGGIFLPFRDLSNGKGSYGGGRYLYDTIKGADLGAGTQALVLDFNFAYNPSCAYNDQWICPLALPENRLPVVIEAGEKDYHLSL